MTIYKYTIPFVLLFSVLSGCGSSSATSPVPGDGNYLISGRYLYTSRGYDTTGKPFYEVGEIIADGLGNWHLDGWMNISGQIVRADSQWVYNVTGLQGTANSVPAGDSSYIYVSADGSRINMIQNDPSGGPWMAIFDRDK